MEELLEVDLTTAVVLSSFLFGLDALAFVRSALIAFDFVAVVLAIVILFDRYVFCFRQIRNN